MYLQAAREASTGVCQRDGVVALAEIIDTFPEVMPPEFILDCVQAAIEFLAGDEEESVTPAALYLVGILFQKVPSEPLEHQFVQGGGHELLLKYLLMPHWTRNEALYVVLAIEAATPALNTVKNAIVAESSENLGALCRRYPPNPIDGAFLVKTEDLDTMYQRTHKCSPDWIPGADAKSPGMIPVMKHTKT
jgi:hypothetical protein